MLHQIGNGSNAVQWQGIVHRDPEPADTTVPLDPDHALGLAQLEKFLFQGGVLHDEDSVHMTSVCRIDRRYEDGQRIQGFVKKGRLLPVQCLDGGDTAKVSRQTYTAKTGGVLSIDPFSMCLR